jgi:cell division protein FtsW
MALSRSQIKKDQKRGGSGRPDFVLIVLIAVLTIIGLIMISSASVVMSRMLTGRDNYYFFMQLAAAGIGLVLLYICSKIDYRFWAKIAPFLLVISIILLIVVFLPGIGSSHNGASRWINLGFTNLQPAEPIKLALILYLAAWFEKKGSDLRSLTKGTLPFLVIVGIIAGLIIIQPDMGTAAVVVSTAGIMFFVAGASLVHVGSLLLAGIASVWVLIKAAPYRMARLTIFLNPSTDSTGAGYQIKQALVAVGSGGIFGLGFGRSIQKFNYLPEAATDSIFAIISEELGLIRAGIIIVIILLFVLRGYKIAREAPDTFSRLTAVGITTWVAAQSFINIMAILGLMPLTGVPLPFISYGGTSLVMLLAACGILLNISKHAVEGGGNNANRRIGRWDWRTYLSSFGGRHRTAKAR